MHTYLTCVCTRVMCVCMCVRVCICNILAISKSSLPCMYVLAIDD